MTYNSNVGVLYIMYIVFVYQVSLTSPLFIEVRVPNKESQRAVMYMCWSSDFYDSSIGF